MVQYWSAVATRDARLATLVLGRLPAKPASTAWATYLRCHDDIGWAVLDEDAAALGWSGFAHRRFLADFYAGKFPGSFARGEVFQDNPVTGDRRTSGTLASLAGLEDALAAGDPGWSSWPSAGSCSATPWSSATTASRCSTWATSWACATTTATSTTRPGRPTTAGCTARRWTGTGPAPHRAGHGRAAHLLRHGRAGRGPGPHPQLHAATPVEVVDLQQPQLFAFAAIRSGPWSRSTTSPSSPSTPAPWPCTWSATTSRWTASPASRPGSTTARSSSTPTRPSGSPPPDRRPGQTKATQQRPGRGSSTARAAAPVPWSRPSMKARLAWQTRSRWVSASRPNGQLRSLQHALVLYGS